MRNQILLTLDSLRWDVFQEADAPFLKGLGDWKKGFTQATYTFPAHMSFFAGKLPQTTDNTDFYDTVAFRVGAEGRLTRNRQLYRLENPEAPRDGGIKLTGRNLIEGFKRHGYATIGAGAMSWFNPVLPAGKFLTEGFDYFFFREGPKHASHASARHQIEWALEVIAAVRRPYFLFINFGETHHRFVYEGCPWFDQPFAYGNAAECRRRQRACLEYLDTAIAGLLGQLSDYDLVICSDHGEAFGEDGLWGHGFYHPVIMEVPMLIRAGAGVQASACPGQY
jgi:arylsulfatase A-like enzyme